jgi:hypothetical protein
MRTAYPQERRQLNWVCLGTSPEKSGRLSAASLPN